MQPLRHALRSLFKSSGLTVAAIVTLALGIGAVTAIFTVVNGVLLRPLPYAEPQSLVVLWESNAELGLPLMFAAPGNVGSWMEATAFAEIGTYLPRSFTLTGRGEPERIQGARASANMFSLLGVEPLVGRTFLPEEGRRGAPPVVILGGGLWQRRFGGDRDLLGRTVEIDGTSHEVVGIMPAGFRFPPPIAIEGTLSAAATELWVPWAVNYQSGSRSARFLFALGRLRPGVSLAAARAELAGIMARLAQELPESNQGWTTTPVPLSEQVSGPVRTALYTLLAAVGLVLLLACANVANLLLARGLNRQKEMAIRSALGAGRGRIARQLLVESLVLGLLGGVGGVLLAGVAVQALVRLAPPNLPRLDEIAVDWRVLGFATLVGLVAGVLTGLAPVFQINQMRLQSSLTERSANAGQTRTQILRKGLVVAEIVLALVVLTGAGLLIKSLYRLLSVDPGFRSENVMTFTTTLPEARYDGPPERAHFVADVVHEIAGLPAVEAVGVINQMPLADDRDGTSFWVEGEPEPAPNQAPLTNLSFVSPGYFAAMGIPLVTGRAFSAADRLDTPPVILINESLARRHFPDRDPIGKRLMLEGEPNEIVGVVGDVRHAGLGVEASPNAYYPYLQQAWATEITVVVRSRSQPTAVLGAVRELLRSRDPGLPVFSVRTMRQIVADSVAHDRFSTLLLTVFAVLALLLAAVGVYGVISYSVRQRGREMGIRIALGAGKREILGLVIRGAMSLVWIGIAAGLVGAVLVTRFLASLLYGVSPTDLTILAIVSAVLAGVALAACYVPARRATRVDPVVSLRAE